MDEKEKSSFGSVEFQEGLKSVAEVFTRLELMANGIQDTAAKLASLCGSISAAAKNALSISSGAEYAIKWANDRYRTHKTDCAVAVYLAERLNRYTFRRQIRGDLVARGFNDDTVMNSFYRVKKDINNDPRSPYRFVSSNRESATGLKSPMCFPQTAYALVSKSGLPYLTVARGDTET